MIRLFVSAAMLLAAMLLTLLAAFLLTHPGIAGEPGHPHRSAHPVHAPHPHAGLSASECPANPHGVSPRPTHSAKAVIRT